MRFLRDQTKEAVKAHLKKTKAGQPMPKAVQMRRSYALAQMEDEASREALRRAVLPVMIARMGCPDCIEIWVVPDESLTQDLGNPA